jgi:ABC-type Mn2+/Zn2+ transport system permease subunit
MTPLNDYFEIARLLVPSIATAAALGVAGGVTGAFVLLRREALAALALPHTVAVGAAVGLRMGWPTLPPALAAVLAATLLLTASKRRAAGVWLLAALYVGGLCLSFLVIANSGQHVTDMQNLFTGLDVAVTPEQASFAVPLLLAAALPVAVLWRRWLLLAQSPTTAEVAGLHPARWDAAFLCLLSLIVLVGTHALGPVMVLAMLFLPAGAVLPWARRMPSVLAASVLLAQLILALGFILSVENGWPLSHSVGGAGFSVLVVSNVLAAVKGG